MLIATASPTCTLSPYTALFRSGARVERLLQRVKISPDALRDAEALIPTSQGFRFMEESARVEAIENLGRSEEHTTELKSPMQLACRLLLETKKRKKRARLANAR